ncbi:GNAT family protein [Virgibacillus sp. C22-A2]|uniref:GNAT family protein n=1 Tax=Virgibacillus tibetensis TaxID=3042313 RepID=A0ABU6KJN2_9BACI|nr:GNAT family protein [Virgibacillus sp. C22-A2]
MIRQAKLDDAENLASLIQRVESESAYMLYEAGEREFNPDRQQNMIDTLSKQNNSVVFVAEESNQLIGYLIAVGGQARKNKHSAYIVIGIISEYHGKGIGTSMFGKLEHWAMNHGIHRLELTVITENLPGIRLYEKMGFKKEGMKENSLYTNGRYVNEYYMSKLLEG